MTTPPRQSRLLDLALVRAVADAERDGAAWLDDPGCGSENLPGAVPEDDDWALIERARRIGGPRGLTDELARANAARTVPWIVAAVCGFLAGAGAAWAGLAGGGDPTTPDAADLNPLWFLQITLGVHTLLFLISLAATGLALGGLSHPWAAFARSVGGWIARAIARGSRSGGGAAALVATSLSGRRGVWIASGLSHAAGLAFITGAIVALLTAAGFREQYRFFWKSTLLTNEQAAGLIDAVAAAPRAVGLPTPTREEIEAARAADRSSDAQPAAEQDPSEWAWMLVGGLLLLGAVPRLVGLGVAGAGVSISTSRMPLPVSASYRRRALDRERWPRMEPGRTAPGVHLEAAPPPPPGEDDRPIGKPVVLAYEIDAADRWPPRVFAGAIDLGVLDGASDRLRALTALDDAATRPSALVACFSRGETPAEAERRFIEDLVARAGERVAVVLSLSAALATARTDRDAERIAHRTALWRGVTEAAGVRGDRVIEADLHHQTEATAAAMRGLLGATAAAPVGSPGEALLRAMDDIDAWSAAGNFSPESTVALHRTVGSRFGSEPRWRQAVRSAAAGEGLDEAKGAAVDGVRALTRVMPGWMPRHPAWMAATATLVTTATLGVVAVAGGPIGIAASAWPLYAAVGAAIGEVTGRGAGAAIPKPATDEDAAAAGARAAVLHALVLALQGRPDAEIARTIDAVLRDAPEIASAADVPALTSHVRTRAAELESEGLL